MKRISTMIVCILVAILPCCIMGCTPTEEPPLSEKIKNADVVLLGEVLKQYPNSDIPGEVYTAEMKIFCILKAPENFPINVVHNISEAGIVHGRCFSVTLDVGGRYIVLGHTSGSRLTPYDSGIEATNDNIQTVSQFCGLSPRLPTGFDTKVTAMCPTNVDQNGCIVDSGHADDHAHNERDHPGHGHGDHDDDHHSDDHSHDHAEHHHDDNEHDHDADGKHTHLDHHDGHDHPTDDHDHADHHEQHGKHDHDHPHDEHSTDHNSSAHAEHDHDDHDDHDDHQHEAGQHASADGRRLRQTVPLFLVLLISAAVLI